MEKLFDCDIFGNSLCSITYQVVIWKVKFFFFLNKNILSLVNLIHFIVRPTKFDPKKKLSYYVKNPFSFSLSFQTEMCGITGLWRIFAILLAWMMCWTWAATDRKNDIIPCLSTPNQHTKNGKKLCKKNKIYLPIFFLPFNSKTVPIAKRMVNIH